jgi:hypothetical protein
MSLNSDIYNTWANPSLSAHFFIALSNAKASIFKAFLLNNWKISSVIITEIMSQLNVMTRNWLRRKELKNLQGFFYICVYLLLY